MTFRTYTLGEIFYIENGYAFKSSEFKATGTPVIKIKNIKAGYFKDDEFSYVESIFLKLKPNKVTRPDDLLISMSGNRHDGNPDTWVGKVCRFNKNEKMLINQRVGALRFRSPTLACANYMGYLLSQMLYQEYFISIATSSGGQANLSPNQILSMEVTLPTISKQSAIASILGSLDDKIDLNRRTNETLGAMARALFRDWFVDFGPTRAKMSAEAPYLAPELWELFPDRLDDEGKPEGWLDGTIGNWANLNSLSWKRQNYPETVNYLDLSSVKHGIINDISKMSAQEAPSRAQRILRTGETVIGTVRPGNGSYAYIDREGLTGSTGFACFYAEDKKFREFIYFALTDKENIDRLTHLADGGAYPAVRPDVVADTSCILSEQTVSAFHTVVSSWMNKISANNIESHTLAQLRDLLLPKLMSGEISIRDAEKMVEDAA